MKGWKTLAIISKLLLPSYIIVLIIFNTVLNKIKEVLSLPIYAGFFLVLTVFISFVLSYLVINPIVDYIREYIKMEEEREKEEEKIKK